MPTQSRSTKEIAETLWKWSSDLLCPSSSLRLPTQGSHSQKKSTSPSLNQRTSTLATRFLNKCGVSVSTVSRTSAGLESTSTTYQLAEKLACTRTSQPRSNGASPLVSYSVSLSFGRRELLTVLQVGRGLTLKVCLPQTLMSLYLSSRNPFNSHNVEGRTLLTIQIRSAPKVSSARQSTLG